MSINWYKDKILTIQFEEVPYVSVRVAVPSMTDAEKKSVKKYPFINKKALKVRVTYHADNDRIHEYTIPKGYCWNGSDIPRCFWRIVGAKSEPQYLVASMNHDYVLENRHLIFNDRKLSTEIFRGCLITAGVGKVKAQIMASAVNLFQKVCGKWNDN